MDLGLFSVPDISPSECPSPKSRTEKKDFEAEFSDILCAKKAEWPNRDRDFRAEERKRAQAEAAARTAQELKKARRKMYLALSLEAAAKRRMYKELGEEAAARQDMYQALGDEAAARRKMLWENSLAARAREAAAETLCRAKK